LRLPITPSNVGFAAVDEAEGDGAALGAVQDGALDLRAELVPGRVEREVEFAGEARQHLHVIWAGRLRLRPGHDRALLEAERLVRDDQHLVEDQLFAQAVAGRARALRGIEGEQPRLDLGDGEAGDGAGEPLGEGDAAGRGVLARDELLVALGPR
jgi:hypothetical protein